MLVCPQCQFDNPDENKFCQRCGESLIHKLCPKCQVSVPWWSLTCPECGTQTGQTWLALIFTSTPDSSFGQPATLSNPDDLEVAQAIATSPSATISLDGDSLDVNHLAGAISNSPGIEDSTLDRLDAPASDSDSVDSEVPTPVKISQLMDSAASSTMVEPTEPTEPPVWLNQTFDVSQIPTDDALNQAEALTPERFITTESATEFLDPQHRYQLLNSVSPLAKGEALAITVLDCQPLQLSPLQIWQQQLEANQLSDPDLEAIPGMENLIIPLAQAYLALEINYGQFLPPLHDAWNTADHEIILLADYSRLPLLQDHIAQQNVPSKQIIQWLQQMTALWVALEPLHCCQSLLELNNLRVSSEDPPSPETNPEVNPEKKLEQLCLGRLYFDFPGTSPTLTDLGQAWKTLLQNSQSTLFGKLTEVLTTLSEGEIQTVDQLHQELAIALEQVSPTLDSNPSLETDSLEPRASQNLADQVADLRAAETQISSLVNLESAGRTDVGQKRNQNEDFFSVQTFLNYQQTPRGQVLEATGIYILCDGMGGHAGGEVASQLAVDTLRQYFQSQWVGELPTEATLQDAILQANGVIYEFNQRDVRAGSGRMGTTLALLIVANNRVAIAHVGDSRVYRVTAQAGLEQVTIDHEVGQREIQQGISPELAYMRPDAYQLTQALGPRDEKFLRPDVQFLDITEDTLFVLASDGLTDNDLLEKSIETHLLPLLNQEANLQAGAAALVDLANQFNGHDNITVILVRALHHRP